MRSARPLSSSIFLASELGFEVRSRKGTPTPYVRVDAATLSRFSPRLLWDLAPTAHGIASAFAPTQPAEGIALADTSIDPVAIFTALHAQELRLVPDNRRTVEQTASYRGIRVRLKFRSGAEVPDSDLTFGQRRYLYAAIVSRARPGAPIVADELDNGMHPRLVLALLEMWSDRQIFVASHNKLVIDSTDFLSPADVREKIHIVRRRDDGRQVVKVFDEEAARELHAKIEGGIQSPSDVLEAEGLW